MGPKPVDIPNALLPALTILTFLVLGRSRSQTGGEAIFDVALNRPQGKPKLLKTVGGCVLLLLVYAFLLASLRDKIEANVIVFGAVLCGWAVLQFLINVFLFKFGTVGVATTILWLSVVLIFLTYSYVSTKHIAVSLFWSCGFILIGVSTVSWLAFSLLRK